MILTDETVVQETFEAFWLIKNSIRETNQYQKEIQAIQQLEKEHQKQGASIFSVRHLTNTVKMTDLLFYSILWLCYG